MAVEVKQVTSFRSINLEQEEMYISEIPRGRLAVMVGLYKKGHIIYRMKSGRSVSLYDNTEWDYDDTNPSCRVRLVRSGSVITLVVK